MAKKDRIKELKQKYGDLEKIIPALVNKGGQKLAADQLKTSTSTISRWLEDNDYIGRMLWQKKTTLQERADIDAAAERVNARRVEQGLPTLEEEEEFS